MDQSAALSPLKQQRCDAIIDFFAAYNAAVIDNAFQWTGQPSKITLSLGGSGPPSRHLIHGTLGLHKSALKNTP